MSLHLALGMWKRQLPIFINFALLALQAEALCDMEA